MSKLYSICCMITLLMLFGIDVLYAQQSVTGRVTDSNGALPGVSVTVVGTNRATQTSIEGNYSIQASNGEKIRFSILGYVSQIITITSSTHDVVLQEEAGNIDEVVVTAMGIKRAPKELGYAMSTVEAKELTKTGSPNFAGALYGKAPGVRISASPGGATSGININIRGTNSISLGSQPLVIIDGVPMRQSGFNNSNFWGDSRSRGNGLEDLNPEDIETISVLKGASAAALYGSEAMNGVVVVTTKSGKGGQGFSIDFNTTYTHDQIAYLPRFQDVRGPGYPVHYADGGQAADRFFYYGQDQAINGVNRGVLAATVNFGPKFDGLPTIAWDGVVRPYSAQNAYGKFFNNPNNTIFNVALGHATESSNIRFSLSRQDNEMTSMDSYNRKNIANLNSNFKLWDKFTTDVVVNFINQDTYNRPYMTDRLINNFTGMISTWDNPEWYLNKYQTSLGYRAVMGSGQSLTPNENIRYNGYKADVLDYFWNIKARQYQEFSNRIMGSFTNTWQATENLTLRARFSADITSAKLEDKKPNTVPLEYGNNNDISQYQLTNQTGKIYYTDLLATYALPINDENKLTAMAGYTATKYEFLTQNSYTDGGLSVRNWFNLNASVNNARTNSTVQHSLRDAIFGTLNYNFNDYWFVEGTLRRERISMMHPKNSVLYYPSVNTSLILNEAFEMPDYVNYAKLRASWGIVGNYPMIFQSPISYTQNTLGDQNTGGSVIYTLIPTSSFGNFDIKPETKKEVEFGIEAKFLNNRLGFDVTYYNGQIRDQILDLSLPISSGSSSILANVGTLRNQGWEFAINGTPIQSDNFRWSSTLNFAFNRNKVEKLTGESNEIQHSFIDGDAAKIVSRVGESLGDIYVRPVRKNDDGEQIVASNGLYALDNTKYVFAGNSLPKSTGGFFNSFTYKNFTLDALIDYRWGGYMMPTGINWMMSRGLLEETLQNMDAEHGGITYYKNAQGVGIAHNGATGPNGEEVYDDGMLIEGVLDNGSPNTNVISQSTYFNSTYNWGGPQYSSVSRYELYVKKNNYIKMREISLAYRLPTEVANRLRAKNLTLSAFGRNLFFLYRSYKHLDPEQMTGGSHWTQQITNAGTAPATRTYGLMLRASF
ncbi:SusC/RagA family TonB-linked outer membrane protein [Sphingobacterium sp. HJSM2_6]